MIGAVIRRRVVREPAPAPCTPVVETGGVVVELPRKRGWENLRKEVRGAFAQLGEVDATLPPSRPQEFETRSDWERILP